jgi:DNA-binding MarR family transcriptional regulator
VLLNLAEAPEGRLRMQELSASVLLSKSGLSRLVDRMVEAGLVRRERCEDDRRGWFAVLTDQGRSALRRAAPIHLRGIHEHFTSHLRPEEVKALTSALSRVVAAARTTAGAAPAVEAEEPEDQEALGW